MNAAPIVEQTHETQREDRRGTLFVFEGPDGVGKTSIVAAVEQRLLEELRQPVVSLAFPGRVHGSLGYHVYKLHHNPSQFGVDHVSPTSLQLLHVAAHLDAIDRFIRPQLRGGAVVLLDRYWWSTWVYGITGGAEPRTLGRMIELERTHWANIVPDAVFLIRRLSSFRGEENSAGFAMRSAEYARLAEAESRTVRVVSVDNNQTIGDAASSVVEIVRETLRHSIG